MRRNQIYRNTRFLLEFAALAALCMWGLRQSPGQIRFLWAIGLPLVAGGLWLSLRAQDYRKTATGRVPGIVRLGLELVLLGFAIWTVFDLGATALGWAFALAVVLHYVLSYDRVLGLLRS
ncbi:MAG: YrdB family protein [Anaerolineae bacterium]|jgi:hypothetical protein